MKLNSITSLLILISIFTGCTTTPDRPEGNYSAADLKIDLVNPVISGSSAAKTDSVKVKADTVSAITNNEQASEKTQGEDIIKKGAALIETSRCLTCHKTDTKFIGPAYADVAKKYPATTANISMLVAKVKNGGMGVWGEFAMPPNEFPDDDIRAMVTYILSLRE